jgi:hypothetical protein
MMARWNIRARAAQAGALLVAAMLCAAAAPAAAEVRVTDAGNGRLVVEARDATVQQILEALGESRQVHFKPSEALSRHVTGTYSGTLPRVLSRILEGLDHVIRSTSSGTQVDIVGAAAQSAKFTGAAATSVTTMAVMPRTAHGISSNVDLDEERTVPKSVPGPQTVNSAAAPQPSAPPSPPSRATLTGNVQHSGAPRVSGNVDLDEETAR